MNTINAQEYINQLVADKSQAQKIHIFLEQEKLSGELIIADYPNIDTIDLKNQELTTLTINNCPNLKSVNVRGNQLTKLEIVNCEQVSELMAGNNELSQLDLSSCATLKKLIIADNAYLTKIKGLNLATLKKVNVNNTEVSLSSELEELKQQVKYLCEIVKKTDDVLYQKELVLEEPIQTLKQAQEAIQRQLLKTGTE